VEVVARWLRDQGLKVFQALGTCRAAAVFVGSREMGDWQQREQYVALERQRATPHSSSSLCCCLRRTLGWASLVKTRGPIYGSSVQTTPLSSLSWWRRSAASPSTDDTSYTLNATRATLSPYQSWHYFREEDAPFFFGREGRSAASEGSPA
jgi:hypothetical protein